MVWRSARGAVPGGEPASCHPRPPVAAPKDQARAGRLQIVEHDQVGAAAGNDSAAVVQAEIVGGIPGGHADRHDRVDALGDGGAHHEIDVPFIQQVGGLAVIGAEADAVMVVP